MKFLFSITAHESINALNDLIQSIMYFNKDSYVIIHANSNWNEFTTNDLMYINEKVFVNPNRFLLTNKMSGKTGIHISNIEYFNSLNIDYDFTVLAASNELYIKKIDKNYFEKNEYGSDFLSVSIDSIYYKTIPHVDTHFINSVIQNIKNQLNFIGKNFGIFGGRHEGMFFNKKLSTSMVDIYREHFGHKIDLCRCDEEIIPHTILYNLVNPTDTESICYFHNHNFEFGIETVYDFIKPTFIPTHDLFTKTKNNFNKFSIKGIQRNDFHFRDNIKKLFIE